MKIHVLGSNGYIAKRFLEHLDRKEVLTYSRYKKYSDVVFDIEKYDEFNYDNFKIGDYVIFLAAISSPDECNKNYEYAYNINVIGTKNIIKKLLDKGCRVLFFSSDVAYGDYSCIFDENSASNPFGNYGRMKYEIEEMFKKYINFKVFRLSYVFSKDDKFMQYLLKCSKNNITADVYDSLYRNVVYIDDVICGIINLIKTFDRWDNYLFNICGSDLLSRKNLVEIYTEVVDRNLKYNVSKPSESFLLNRPKTINVKSIYFEKLLGRTSTKIKNAIIKEFF